MFKENCTALKVKAVWDFVAENESQLSFPGGAIIKVTIPDFMEGWWRGEYEGKEGIFPTNYVQVCLILFLDFHT